MVCLKKTLGCWNDNIIVVRLTLIEVMRSPVYTGQIKTWLIGLWNKKEMVTYEKTMILTHTNKQKLYLNQVTEGVREYINWKESFCTQLLTNTLSHCTPLVLCPASFAVTVTHQSLPSFSSPTLLPPCYILLFCFYPNNLLFYLCNCTYPLVFLSPKICKD